MSDPDPLLIQLARFAAAELDPASTEAIERNVSERVLDTIGVALAARDAAAADPVAQVVEAWGGAPQASLFGRSVRLPAAAAALHNGTLAHALDFDDTHLPSVLHPSASIVPAALAAGQACAADGPRVVRAVAVGDEICVRLGMAGYDPELGNSVFFERGLHATSICGAIGAAAAVGIVLDLDEERLGHAMAVAASMGAGLLEANRSGGTVKQAHCGWAAHAGVSAAELARAGLTGPPTVFEGRFGFLQAYLGERADPGALVRDLGCDWELLKLHYKPYPTNHFTHAGIDAALALRAEGVRPEDVDQVRLGVATPTLRTIAEPRAAKARPPSGYAAKFSGPFTFAVALAGGGGLGVSLEDFTDERARDPELLALADRVHCVADPDCNAAFPQALPAVVSVRLNDGTTREQRVMENRGGPGRPLSEDELRLKFLLNARASLPEERATALMDAAASLADLDSMDELVALTEAG
jgi:2-methylcitrate dehydratase PrpD